MALKLAHFPAVKELAGFAFEAQPSIDPRQIRDLAASRWIASFIERRVRVAASSLHSPPISCSLLRACAAARLPLLRSRR